MAARRGRSMELHTFLQASHGGRLRSAAREGLVKPFTALIEDLIVDSTDGGRGRILDGREPLTGCTAVWCAWARAVLPFWTAVACHPYGFPV